MRWGVFCSALAFAAMVATVGVADGRAKSADDGGYSWDDQASPLRTPVTRPVRATEARPRLVEWAPVVALASVTAGLTGPEHGSESVVARLALALYRRGLCQGQTSRGPPAA